MYCKGVVLDDCKEKKKIFVFFAARFIVSEWLMTRNYPDIITYVFVKSGLLHLIPRIYVIIYCVTTEWFNPPYLFYNLLYSYKVAMPLISLFLRIFILSFIVFLQSGYAANFPIPLHKNIILLGFMFKCYVTKSIMLCFGA